MKPLISSMGNINVRNAVLAALDAAIMHEPGKHKTKNTVCSFLAEASRVCEPGFTYKAKLRNGEVIPFNKAIWTSGNGFVRLIEYDLETDNDREIDVRPLEIVRVSKHSMVSNSH